MRALDEEVGWLLARAALTLGGRLDRAVRELGVSLRGYTLLVALLTTGPGRSVALADAIGIDKTTMTVTADELEAAGLVRRVADATDRRARVLEPTDAGRAVAARAEVAVRAVEDDALADLAPAEREALRDALRTLVRGRLSAPVDGRGARPARRRP